MNTGKTLFAQLMDFLPWTTFTRIVDRYGGDHRVRTLSCAQFGRQLVAPLLEEPIKAITRSCCADTERANRPQKHNATLSVLVVRLCPPLVGESRFSSLSALM